MTDIGVTSFDGGRTAERRGPLPESIDAAQRAVLELADLRVEIPSDEGIHRVVDGVSVTCRSGRTLGVVGESGSGKTMTFLAVMGLLPERARITGGEARLHGRDVLGLGAADRRRLRGELVAMIFQDALTGLSPSFTIGRQLVDVLRHHTDLSRDAARRRALEVLDLVRVPNGRQRFHQYPHELSGGLRQRVMIGMGVALQPDVLIADEPTTALDVTVQEQVLDLLQQLRDELGMSLVLITHDLGLVARYADDVATMYAGRVVERGSVADLFDGARHPYTIALRRAIPRPDVESGRLEFIPGHPPRLNALPPGCSFEERCAVGRGRPRCQQEQPVLEPVAGDVVPAADGVSHRAACHYTDEVAANVHDPAPTGIASAGGIEVVRTHYLAERGTVQAEVVRVRSVSKVYRARRRLVGHAGPTVHAVDDVSFVLHRGETLGLVGESGCGKSTLSRLILGLDEPTTGHIELPGSTSAGPGRGRHVQIVFQDPYASLDPRQRIRQTLAEPLRAAGVPAAERDSRVEELLQRIGQGDGQADRYPHQFSGGQRQRIGIARSVAAHPSILVLDEPVSALDVSIQAQILNMLQDLRDELGLSYLLISHDLAVIRHVTDRIMVMYLGQLVESATTSQLFEAPRHPYTEALLSAAPIPDPVAERSRHRVRLHGSLGTDGATPTGCPLHPRCRRAREVAAGQADAVSLADGGRVPSSCVLERPVLAGPADHTVACHFAEQPTMVPLPGPRL